MNLLKNVVGLDKAKRVATGLLLALFLGASGISVGQELIDEPYDDATPVTEATPTPTFGSSDEVLDEYDDAQPVPNLGSDESPSSPSGATWRDAADDAPKATVGGGASNLPKGGTAPDAFTGPKNTRFSFELSKLPNLDGQFWIVYDISPYTERFPNLSEPQNSIVDWILFDSGKDFWRKEPFAVLSATRDRLYVYHGPSVQKYVSNIIDRFIDPSKRGVAFSVTALAVQNPEWRTRMTQYLAPTKLSIEGNGIDAQGWLLDRVNFDKISSDLKRRQDVVLINSANEKIPNGETFGWSAASPRKTYARDYRADSSAASGYLPDTASVDEGYRVEVTPLLSTTGETLETRFHYQATIVERTKNFSMRIPTATAPRQQLDVERPMIVSCDVSGKIAVPRGKAALIDLGMVPFANAKKTESNGGLIDSVSGLVSSKSAFYDLIIMIEGVE